MAFDEPEVRVMFPVPLVTIQMKSADKLNRRLIAEIAKRRKSEPGIDRSNRYGWHSEPDLFKRAEPAHADIPIIVITVFEEKSYRFRALDELGREIEAMVAAVTRKMMPDLPKDFSARHEGWVNVNPTHAMNAPHDHPGAFWSGTYYIKVPLPGDEEDKLSGAIEFIDPRGAIGNNARMETPFTRPKFTVRPAAGTLLLWPSFVKHWVHPNHAKEERMTAAFNSWYSRAAGAS